MSCAVLRGEVFVTEVVRFCLVDDAVSVKRLKIFVHGVFCPVEGIVSGTSFVEGNFVRCDVFCSVGGFFGIVAAPMVPGGGSPVRSLTRWRLRLWDLSRRLFT